MRIFHLVISGDVAGGQLVALQLMRAARTAGHEVAVVSPGTGPFIDLVRDEGIPVHHADVSRTFHIRGAVRLARLLRAERADILHTHTAVAANILARVAGRIAGARVVTHLHAHNTFRRHAAAAAAMRLLDNVSARLASRIIAVSASVGDSYACQGYPAGRIVVIPNGIEVGPLPASRPSRIREEVGVPAGVPVLGEIGRLCAQKGQETLIAAAASLPGAQVLLVGDDLEQEGAYQHRLERLALAAGVADRVFFTGYLGDTAAVIDELDVFVLPSWIEGMPLVLLEAMGRARPVVSTAVGGIPEVVEHGVTGLLVRPGDPAALAHALQELLADPDRARAMGEAGRKRVQERFSAAAATSRVLEVYDELAR